MAADLGAQISEPRQKLEMEVKDQIAARRVQKAGREKLRRDKLNEQFLELGNTLGPDRPKNDKATILVDTIQVLKDLTAEVNRLMAECSSLTEESRERRIWSCSHGLVLILQVSWLHLFNIQFLCLLLQDQLQCTTPHCNRIHFSEIIIPVLPPIPAQHSCHIQPVAAVLQLNNHHPYIHLLPTLLAQGIQKANQWITK